MLCKSSSNDPKQCLLEGRKVTRCALDLIAKVKGSCGQEFDKNWECLDMNNQMYQKCRPQERVYNDCVFKKLGIEKSIPTGTEKGQEPIHLKKNPIYK
jgi:NADH dehydrogenase (ubiquinone) 1 alpha subcomplex subunit 8